MRHDTQFGKMKKGSGTTPSVLFCDGKVGIQATFPYKGEGAMKG
ncbi:hypothetical protein [Maribacter chungangensis]